MIEYKIKKSDKDPKQTVVEKFGDTVTMSIAEIENNTLLYGKKKRECEGMITLNGAKMKNVLDHHPFVGKLSGEDLAAAYLYAEAQGLVKEAERQLAIINENLKVDAEEIAEILKQLPELAKAGPKVEAIDKK